MPPPAHWMTHLCVHYKYNHPCSRITPPALHLDALPGPCGKSSSLSAIICQTRQLAVRADLGSVDETQPGAQKAAATGCVSEWFDKYPAELSFAQPPSHQTSGGRTVCIGMNELRVDLLMAPNVTRLWNGLSLRTHSI